MAFAVVWIEELCVWIALALIDAGFAGTAIFIPNFPARAFINKVSIIINDSWDALANAHASKRIPFSILILTLFRVASALACF